MIQTCVCNEHSSLNGYLITFVTGYTILLSLLEHTCQLMCNY